MARVFLSYAREDLEPAKALAEALERADHQVWWDRHIHGGSRFASEIDRALTDAEVVVVLWSETSIQSAWVQDEAAEGRDTGRLVPVVLDGNKPPLGFRQFQAIELGGSNERPDESTIADLLHAIEQTAGADELASGSSSAIGKARTSSRLCVCVVPFVNMSGDSEQEYFSDGITEDIIVDLSHVSALSVVPRNSAFSLKGKLVDAKEIAKALNVSHILEGSVRKAGGRVRITAQLVDGKTGDHLWAERFDRDLTDIFAIQDEISKAIVAALQLKLLPAEKKAIEQRGTSNTDAYELYLMARQFWASGNDGDPRKHEVILRLTRSAVELDPDYARAWALMALAQGEMSHRGGQQDGMTTAERALRLDPTLPEPHCVKAGYFARHGEQEKANAEIETALQLDPDSWEAAKEAGFITYRQGRIDEALRHFERAAALMETDIRSAMMLASTYRARGDSELAAHYSRTVVERVERVVEQDRSNGSARAYGAVALAVLGETDRAKEWMRRALFIDPENLIMRYNLACACAQGLNDPDGALDLLQPYLENVSPAQLRHVEVDPCIDTLRDLPRFRSMIAEAKQRLAV